MIAASHATLAGVIAAGHGVRLRHDRHTLKPLVPVAGVTLVERVLTSLAEVQPSAVIVIVNDASTAVRDHVSGRSWPFALDWIVETTPSSMHSFLRIVETLTERSNGEPFFISTVDTIAAPGAFAAFAAASRAPEVNAADVVLAVSETPEGDDKPLLVSLAPGSSRVLSIGAAAQGSKWATAGYYRVRPSVMVEAAAARRDGLSALRQFLGRLQDRGLTLAAVPVAAGVDVDRPRDVGQAEQFLKRVGV